MTQGPVWRPRGQGTAAHRRGVSRGPWGAGLCLTGAPGRGGFAREEAAGAGPAEREDSRKGSTWEGQVLHHPAEAAPIGGGAGAWTQAMGSATRLCRTLGGGPQGSPGQWTAGRRAGLCRKHSLGRRKGQSSHTRPLPPAPQGTSPSPLPHSWGALAPAWTSLPREVGPGCPRPSSLPSAAPRAAPPGPLGTQGARPGAARPGLGVQWALGLGAQPDLAWGQQGPRPLAAPGRRPAPSCACGRNPNYPESCQEIKDVPTCFQTSL